ncbi:hypothetical protein F504_3590 (plasmid) [Ralstonia pseudosolanacearum FQY_4]|nr:hypothetical protein F504_3590 [Ralstonia pseudosolanacearum FQY_4]
MECDGIAQVWNGSAMDRGHAHSGQIRRTIIAGAVVITV